MKKKKRSHFTVGVSMDADTYEQIKQLASDSEETMSRAIYRIIYNHFKSQYKTETRGERMKNVHSYKPDNPRVLSKSTMKRLDIQLKGSR